jgi:hypothetical protein
MSERQCDECLEQARLLAMSGERESALRGKLFMMERALSRIAAAENSTVEELRQLAKNGLSWNKPTWPNDDNPFESADHDNDDFTYDELRAWPVC